MTYEETAGSIGQIPYFDTLNQEEKGEVTEGLKLLLRQTFVLAF